jgi:hypothetical protein
MSQCMCTALPITGSRRSFYRYHRDVLGMDEAKAHAEMEAVWHPEGVWAGFVER